MVQGHPASVPSSKLQRELTATGVGAAVGATVGAVAPSALAASLGSLAIAGLTGGPLGLLIVGGALGGAVGGYYASKLRWRETDEAEEDAAQKDEDEYKIKTISELKDENLDVELCWVDGTITEIEFQESPVFLVCPKEDCGGKLRVEYSSCFCSTCSCQVSQPYLGLIVKVTDEQDSAWLLWKQDVPGKSLSVDRLQLFFETKHDEWRRLCREMLFESFRFTVQPKPIKVTDEFEISGLIKEADFLSSLERILDDIHLPVILGRRLSCDRGTELGISTEEEEEEDEEKEEDEDSAERRRFFEERRRRSSSVEDCDLAREFSEEPENKDSEGRDLEERDFEDSGCGDKCSAKRHVDEFLRRRDY